jgi:hypothetical protein
MRSDKATVFCAIALFLPGATARARAEVSTPDAIAGQAEAGKVPERANSPAFGADDYAPLTGSERWNLYLRDAFWSPGVFFRAAGPALGAHLNDEPPQWGQGAKGYSKRLANRFARSAIQETYEAAGAAALGHEVRYVRSKRSGFFPRAAHALAANLVTYDRNGRRAPHISRVGSVFAAEFTGNRWMPAGYRDTSSAFRAAGVQLGVSTAFNIIREFAPELKRVFTGK